MGRLALVEWIESAPQDADGTRFWRPDIPAGIGAWAAFDLRDLGLPGSIVYTRDRDAALPAKGSRFDIGALFTEPLSAQRANQIGNRIGRDVPAGITPIDLIGEIAGDRLRTVDVGGGRLRRVFRIFDQRYELAPIVRGGATDDFNRADGGLGSNWTTCQAAMAISGNKVVIGSNPSSMFYAGTFDADQYSDIDATTSVSGFYMVSAMVRASPSNGAEFYFARVCGSCGDVAVGKRVAFSQTEFASGGSLGTSVPTTRNLRLEVSGNALEAFIGGSSVVTTTDSALTSGNPGIHLATANTTDASIDNFDGGDLSSGPAPQSFSGAITPAAALARSTSKPLAGAVTPAGALTRLKLYFQSLAGSLGLAGSLARLGTIFPHIETSADTSATAGPVAVNMPSGIVAGNLLIAIASTDAAVTATPGGGEGWTQLSSTANSTAVRQTYLAKLAAGSDALNLTLGTSNDCAVHVMRIVRHGVTDVSTDITLGTPSTGTSTTPDPPSVDPPGTGAYLFITSNASDDDDNTTPYAPANYTAQAQVESAQSTSSCMLQVAWRKLSGGAAENPGTFTLAASEEWVAQTIAIPPAPSGTGYTQSLSGAVTLAGLLLRQAQKRALGALTPAGAQARQPAKVTAGTLAPAAVARKSSSKPLAGTAGSSGALAALRLLSRTLSGSAGLAGSVARAAGKVTTGTIASGSTVVRATARVLSSTVAPAGALAKLSPRSFAGSLGLAGIARRTAGKVVGGSITPAGFPEVVRLLGRALSGTIASAGSITRTAGKGLAGTVAPVSTVARAVSRSLAGSLGSAGTIVRSTVRALSSSIAPAGALSKLSPRSFAGTISTSSTLLGLRVLLRSIDGALGLSGLLRRTPDKVVAGTVAPSSTIVRAVSRLLGGSLSPTGIVEALRAGSLLLSGTLSTAGSIARSVARSRSHDGTVAPSGALAREARSHLSAAISAIGGVSRTFGRPVTGAIGPSGETARFTARSLAGLLAPTGLAARLFDRTLSGTLGLASTITNSTGALFAVWRIASASIRDRTSAGVVGRARVGTARRRVTAEQPISPPVP